MGSILLVPGRHLTLPGGLLADSIGWRWAFIGQGPLCLIAFAAVALFLKLPKKEDSHWRTKLRRIDFLGAIVLVAAVTCLLLGLDRGSNVSWSSPPVIAILALFVPLFAAFVAVEQKVATEPFAPGRVIFDRSLFAAYMCNATSMGGLFSVLFYLPLFYQAVDNMSASHSGLLLLPGVATGVVGSLLGGIIMQKTGKVSISTFFLA